LQQSARATFRQNLPIRVPPQLPQYQKNKAEASQGLGSSLERRHSSELKLFLARHDQILTKLEQETRRVGSPNVMVAVADPDLSLMQSALAEQAIGRAVLHSGALEAKFGTGLNGGDWFGWLKSTLDWVDRQDAHELLRPANAEALDFGDDIRVWPWRPIGGQGLYGAPEIAEQIKKRARFDLLLHPGNVYYAGTKNEVQERMLDFWPKDAGKLTRVLNSNHEMYSGGYGYFDLEFRAFVGGI
jgi:hypothetical protein